MTALEKRLHTAEKNLHSLVLLTDQLIELLELYDKTPSSINRHNLAMKKRELQTWTSKYWLVTGKQKPVKPTIQQSSLFNNWAR
ncbi:MAG: hypothetical protein EKK37_17465 [Sphingobacteriales bacterium]|nr:MAG: hypothetical protein EKK37_17465 [Sphingobacteriales bacterium]